MFINAVEMRNAIAVRHRMILPAENLRRFEVANYLFHSAVNSFLVTVSGGGNPEALPAKRFVQASFCGKSDRSCTSDSALLFAASVDRTRLDHIAMDQAPLLSPLHTSCYGDEDLVGKIKALALRSTPQRLGRQVCLRWAAYVGVRWLRRLQD